MFVRGTGNRQKVYLLSDDAEREMQHIRDQHDVHNEDGTIEHTTAAQLVAHLRQRQTDNPHIIMPTRCDEPAPNEINRFSDGSQINPQHQAFALSAAGVWMPFDCDSTDDRAHGATDNNDDDDGDDNDHTTDETRHERRPPPHREQRQHDNVQGLNQFGKTNIDDEAATVEAGIGGQHGNSTRAESFGAIIAICGEGPARIGIDNAACLKAACELLELARHIPTSHHSQLDSQLVRNLKQLYCTGQLRKPWAAQFNGDLWLLMLRCILAKSPNSFAFDKVLGHATLQDIADGKSTHTHAHGNKKADKAADRAINQLGETLVCIANWCAQNMLLTVSS